MVTVNDLSLENSRTNARDGYSDPENIKVPLSSVQIRSILLSDGCVIRSRAEAALAQRHPSAGDA